MLRVVDYQQLRRLFVKYAFASAAAQLVNGLYLIADGYFIGRGAGETGLAATGLAYPIAVLVTAIGTGIGVGGGALMSMYLGMGEKDEAERVIGAMAWLACAASLVITVIGMICAPLLLSLYDTPQEVYLDAIKYARILILSAPFQIFTLVGVSAVRNDGAPKKAMYIMASGFMLNTFCAWLFVTKMRLGVAGGAFASSAAQIFTAVLLCVRFITKKAGSDIRDEYVHCGKFGTEIMKMGISPFGIQASMVVTIILYNWQALAYGGTNGIVAYSVVDYVAPVAIMSLQGLAEGVQPLISRFHGARLYARRYFTARFAFLAAILVGCLHMAAFLFLYKQLPAIFSLGADAYAEASRGLLLISFMFPFLGVVKVGASYFQSVGRLTDAAILTYGDPVLLTLFLNICPIFWDLDGVWLSLPTVYVTLTLCLFLLMRTKSTEQCNCPSCDKDDDEDNEDEQEEAA